MNKIQQTRLSKNLTQLQLSELTKTTQKDISRWENETVIPTVKTLQKLAKAMNCKIIDLIE